MGEFICTCIKTKEYGWWKTCEHADRFKFMTSNFGTNTVPPCSTTVLLKKLHSPALPPFIISSIFQMTSFLYSFSQWYCLFHCENRRNRKSKFWSSSPNTKTTSSLASVSEYSVFSWVILDGLSGHLNPNHDFIFVLDLIPFLHTQKLQY